MNLQLSIGITNNPRTWLIIDGTVKPDGIDLIPTVLHPSELFWRQLYFSEFAVSEMSCSSFFIAVACGDTRFVGLPIFTTRRFFHTSILVRREAGIE
ncbi:MAG: ABC transporter substrate-binding protein, partial [Xanthobacteraceae bacterium]